MPSALDVAISQPESMKGRILFAARRMFGRHGFRGTSTRGIAGEVATDVSALYYHWGSKKELFEAVLEWIELDFEERLRRWVHETRDRPFDECFQVAVDAFADFFLDRDVVRVVLFSFFDDESEAQAWAVRSQRQLIETIRTFIEKRFGFRPAAPGFDAAVVALIHAALSLIGSRGHLADVLSLDPAGTEYRDLVITTLRGLFAAFLTTITPHTEPA